MTEFTIKLLSLTHSDHVRFLDAIDQVVKHFALKETMGDDQVGVCFDALAFMFGPRGPRPSRP